MTTEEIIRILEGMSFDKEKEGYKIIYGLIEKVYSTRILGEYVFFIKVKKMKLSIRASGNLKHGINHKGKKIRCTIEYNPNTSDILIDPFDDNFL